MAVNEEEDFQRQVLLIVIKSKAKAIELFKPQARREACTAKQSGMAKSRQDMNHKNSDNFTRFERRKDVHSRATNF